MSREAWGDPPEQEPQRCPLCDGEWHAEGCELGDEVALRLKAEDERNAADEVLCDAARFLDELPDDLGRGSLNGWKVQLRHKIGEMLTPNASFSGSDAAGGRSAGSDS